MHQIRNSKFIQVCTATQSCSLLPGRASVPDSELALHSNLKLVSDLWGFQTELGAVDTVDAPMIESPLCYAV